MELVDLFHSEERIRWSLLTAGNKKHFPPLIMKLIYQPGIVLLRSSSHADLLEYPGIS